MSVTSLAVHQCPGHHSPGHQSVRDTILQDISVRDTILLDISVRDTIVQDIRYQEAPSGVLYALTTCGGLELRLFIV